MADRKKPGSNLSLAREPTVPVRFRCKVGGEWKPLDSFSNSQQKLIQRQLATRGRIDAANSGMACRDHSAITRIEIRCDVCDLIKSAEQFSKRAKKHGENICMRCTAWGETQEPEVTPAPLETGHLSIEEDKLEVWQQNYVESTDFFPGDAMPQAPITELASLGLADHEVRSQVEARSSSHSGSVAEHVAALVCRTSSGTASGSTSQIGGRSDTASVASLPPHLQGNASDPLGPMSTNLEARSVKSFRGQRAPSVSGSESASYGSASIPPHLRSRVSAAYPNAAGQGGGPGSVSTATTLREARELEQENKRVPFNAWGPDGKHYKGIKSPTIPSSASGDSVSAAGSNDSATNVWQTDQPTTNWAKKPRGRDNWHKASRLSAAELRQPEPFAHVSARHVDPGIDRQRRMNYCQSEDSDW
ncbi:hypothetical protein TOPH_02647 [Tolypocladium ophioglossoides CBS 100239]|uniref:Stc1 domain-containing protein n=1 Tax=Tolypocladium ophioglossoides (strain CBS 100239) TaxID=1163406 RepID=A0A0L0NF36_TOLOC|nr:hypothetical protein TOPH_02647 [Tolypocladium ophioglossoides CBS 100239]